MIRANRTYLWCEFSTLFFGLPLLFLLGILSMRLMIPALITLFLVFLLLSLRDPTFDRTVLFNRKALNRAWLPIVVRAIILCTILALAVVVFAPDRLFALLRHNPILWLAIVTLYPLFSVYPQEFLYRAFLHHRYRPILPTFTLLILASAVTFAWVHIILQNWIAPALTLVGGILFALTYEKTRSLAAASLEHSLYGGFIFTIGLGWFFYGGSV